MGTPEVFRCSGLRQLRATLCEGTFVRVRDPTYGTICVHLSKNCSTLSPTFNNTKAKTTHKEDGEEDSLFNFQHHLTPSTFTPPRDLAPCATYNSASTTLSGQPSPQPTALALTDEPHHQAPLRPAPIAPHPM